MTTTSVHATDQVPRLNAFRATYPRITIGLLSEGVWRALIPEQTGETVVTRYELRQLLDRLADLGYTLADPEPQISQLPAGSGSGRGSSE